MAKGKQKDSTQKADAGAQTSAQPKPDEETAGQEQQLQGAPPAGQGEQPKEPATAGRDDQPAADDDGGAKREGKVAALRVSAKGLDRFFRCGLKFTRTPRTLAIEDLEPDHVERIEAEPRLVAQRVEVDAAEVEVLNR